MDKIREEKKERIYGLVGGIAPPAREINTVHRSRATLLYTDPDGGDVMELRYSPNQKSPFVEEQKGNVTKASVFFQGGMLRVPAQNLALQYFLAFHPQNEANNGAIFFEQKPEEKAEVTVSFFEAKAEAFEIIKGLDIDGIEKLMWNIQGDSVFKTSAKELKRDLYLEAEESPGTIVDIYNSKTAELKYIAGKSIKQGFIVVTGDDRVVTWENGKTRITTIPIDKTTTQGLADFFMSDKGEPVLKKLREKLK